MPLIDLPEREAHVWFVRTDAPEDPAVLDAFERVLSPDERERRQRFVMEDGRREYLVSHGFLRLVLSRYADVEPGAWRFVRSAYGKPEIIPPTARPELRSLSFNLTHTSGLAAVVLAWGCEAGIDAETLGRPDPSVDLVGRCLSPEEWAHLHTLPAESRKHQFLDYWTLKEAYLKARGVGLSLPLEGITFRWTPGEPIEAAFTSEVRDDPQTWQFVRLTPTAQHKLAVAIRRPADTDLAISLAEFSPPPP